jgi:hypothetical protein
MAQPTPILIDGVTEKDIGCSNCRVKLHPVVCPDCGEVVGLACGSCNTFWPLVLPEKGSWMEFPLKK